MRTNLRKHGALPVLAGTIALLIGLAVHTHAAKDNEALALKDLTGSRAALDDVAIAGELRDGYHRTSFRLAQGHIAASTELFRQPQFVDNYHYSAGGDKRIGDWAYQVQGSGRYDILSLKRGSGESFFFPFGTAAVSPSITDSHPGDNTVTYANVVEYGLAKIGDKVYFTVPVSSDFTGMSGIYELSFIRWGSGEAMRGEWPAARKIADIDLEANESPEPPNLEVLGLEAVGDKLALLSVEGSELVVRGYDSGSGELLGEATIPDFRLMGRKGTGSEETESYGERYEAFSDPGSSVLSVSFHSSASRRQLLLSFDFSQGVQLVQRMTADFSGDGNASGDGVSLLSYRNGKLYVLKTFREPGDDGSSPSFDISKPQHLYVYVYRQASLLYKGELVSDLNDDSIEAIHQRSLSRSYNYDPTKFRHWMNVTVEPLAAEGGSARD